MTNSPLRRARTYKLYLHHICKRFVKCLQNNKNQNRTRTGTTVFILLDSDAVKMNIKVSHLPSLKVIPAGSKTWFYPGRCSPTAMLFMLTRLLIWLRVSTQLLLSELIEALNLELPLPALMAIQIVAVVACYTVLQAFALPNQLVSRNRSEERGGGEEGFGRRGFRGGGRQRYRITQEMCGRDGVQQQQHNKRS